jgi:coenzyme F420 hydrogenase subunit beta
MKTESLVSRLLRKNWSKEQIDKYIGSYVGSYFSYAKDEKLRRYAASGGSTTAILSYLFQTGEIDGALVCRGIVNEEGKYRGEFYIARGAGELLDSQGSKYVTVDFIHQGMPLIRAFEGRLAVVALPCDTSVLARLCTVEPKLAEKIRYKITLFCQHNSDPALTDAIVDKIRPGDRKLIAFRHKLGLWRGNLQADFEEGHRITRPYPYYSDYQNLFFFCQRKCHRCHDHTGYDADISTGDIWSMRMKEEPIKHNALIAHTQTGDDVVRSAAEQSWLYLHAEPIEEICEGQARGLPFHYNVTVRSRLGWLIGEQIKDTVHERVRLVDYPIAALFMLNEKWSRSQRGRELIFKVPKRLIKLYLFFIKGLESL